MPHYIDQLIKPHLAYCAVRVLKHHMPLKTLVMICYVYFHSRMKYGTQLWGSIQIQVCC
jgi:hypothetical protein